MKKNIIYLISYDKVPKMLQKYMYLCLALYKNVILNNFSLISIFQNSKIPPLISSSAVTTLWPLFNMHLLEIY